MRRIWGWYRGLTTRWQVVIGVVLALAVVGGLTGEEETEPTVSASATKDIADELPFAPTTTVPVTSSTTREVIRTTTTAAPATTTTAAPTTTTTVAPTTTTAAPPPPTTQAFVQSEPASSCHPSYDPCVPYASDVDCASGEGNGPAYTGTVRVIGPDEYDLDSDNDGVGCENG